ncbi:YegP family protein [Roseomonas gilardii]|uniref:YegP family protein n=1 Tax=Roseomonas gilardii TaxID=257708 RepID=UPI0009E02997|nr:DUF1508 domain-containing protein [Roseomonas gilardii]
MYFSIYKNASGQYYWNLKSANHEIVANGETYRNKSDCHHAINLVKSTTATTPVYDYA